MNTNREITSEHISKTISDADDDLNWMHCSANWSQDLREDGKPEDLLFGIPAKTIARLILSEGKPYRLQIDKCFPDFGYDGLTVSDEKVGKRQIHEWWTICFQMMVNEFDIANYTEIDLQQHLELGHLKYLRGELEIADSVEPGGKS